MSEERCVVGKTAVMCAGAGFTLAAQTHDCEETKRNALESGTDILSKKHVAW